MVEGLLRSSGIVVSQNRVGRSLSRTFPFEHNLRRLNMHSLINPYPYRADYFSQKLHFDQNEKLVMYGIVHVIAVDGYSCKIVGFITIPRKNSTAIYNTLFHPILQCYGLWEQLRMDHGTEFSLIITIQEYLSVYRARHNRPSVLRSTSQQNHRAERLV